MSYAKGKHAFGFCDRTGFRYPLKDLVPEYRNGVKTGFLVGRDIVDPDQPQNFLGRIKINDPQSLRNPRPDTALLASRGIVGVNPVGIPAVIATGSVGRVSGSISETDANLITGVSATGAVGSATVSVADRFDSTSVTLDSTSQTFDEE